MTCPFYGHGDTGLGMLIPTQGNQCAVVRIAHSPCRMEMAGRPVEWESCVLRSGRAVTGCIARCVGCNSPSHACYGRWIAVCAPTAEGLCSTCLQRAELLAAEAAGQQRLSLGSGIEAG